MINYFFLFLFYVCSINTSSLESHIVLREVLPFKLGGQEVSQGFSEAFASHAEVSVRVDNLKHPTVDLQHCDIQRGAAQLVHQDVAVDQAQTHRLTDPHYISGRRERILKYEHQAAILMCLCWCSIKSIWLKNKSVNVVSWCQCSLLLVPPSWGRLLSNVIGQQSGSRLVNQPQHSETRSFSCISEHKDMQTTEKVKSVQPMRLHILFAKSTEQWRTWVPAPESERIQRGRWRQRQWRLSREPTEPFLWGKNSSAHQCSLSVGLESLPVFYLSFWGGWLWQHQLGPHTRASPQLEFHNMAFLVDWPPERSEQEVDWFKSHTFNETHSGKNRMKGWRWHVS